MTQVINTNISSLNAQRNLNTSQSSLSTALQRLSSGLRINSAKDDAAGMAIADRMTSQIRGLNQAVRNANDGTSLAQTAEGALTEMGNILQRMRELAIQSANSTNSSTDRASLQSEVNQLKSELSRIANNTTFNGRKLLDGTLQQSQFQIGAEANQTIGLSVRDARATGLGSYSVKTSVDTATTTTNGIAVNRGLEAATKVGFVTASGTQTGKVVAVTGTTNGYAATDITITGPTGTAYVVPTTTANDSAKTIATAINTAVGASGAASASAYNRVVVNATGTADATDGDAITISDGTNTATYTTAIGGAASNSALVTAVNNTAAFVAAGGYAYLDTNGHAVIVSTNGNDLRVGVARGATATGTVDATVQGLNDAAASVAIGDTNTFTAGGRIDVTLALGSSIATSTSTTVFTAAPTATAVGDTAANATTNGNNVAAQSLTVTGSVGSANVTVNGDQTAYDIASSVNQYEGSTGVSASARTTAYIGDLSSVGTVSFTLNGSNTTGVTISANMTGTSNLIDLVTAINAKTGDTGVSAQLTTLASTDGQYANFTNKSVIKLTQADGYNVKISNFTHSAAVDYGVAGTSSTYSRVANEESLVVSGGEGGAAKLYDGGARTNANSTVIGGEVTFNSSGAFNVSSSIAGSEGAIFSGAASSSNASSLATVNAVDVSSVDGANSAISVLDGALAQVNSIRSEMGAFQNRFASTISNLQATAENLTSARSRIQDADFAQETANLTRSQILQQAGVAMLAQANALPNQVLSLLK